MPFQHFPRPADSVLLLAILKDPDAKNRVLALARGLSLVDFDREDLVRGVVGFWTDKDARNRLIHDYWFPILDAPGEIATRGVTRTRTPEVVFRDLCVDDVWALAHRFQSYRDLFSYRTWAIERDQ